MTVTELVTLSVTGDRAETLKTQAAVLEKWVKPAPGLKGGAVGVQVEDPTKWHWFLHWETMDAHKALMENPDYGQFVTDIRSYATLEGLYHATFDCLPELLEKTPVAEVLSVALKPETDKAEFEKGLEAMKAMVDASAKSGGCHGQAVAWGVEDPRKFTTVISWDSKEHHLNWRAGAVKEELEKGLAVFKDGVENVQVCHVEIVERFTI